MTFNNLIEIIVEIREIALLNRATPGSSLVGLWEIAKVILVSLEYEDFVGKNKGRHRGQNY